MGTLFQRGTTIKPRTVSLPKNPVAGREKPGRSWSGATAETAAAESAPNRRISTRAQGGMTAAPRALNPKSFHRNTLSKGYDN